MRTYLLVRLQVRVSTKKTLIVKCVTPKRFREPIPLRQQLFCGDSQIFGIGARWAAILIYSVFLYFEGEFA